MSSPAGAGVPECRPKQDCDVPEMPFVAQQLREHVGQMQDSTNSARWLEGTRAPTGEMRQGQLRADPRLATATRPGNTPYHCADCEMTACRPRPVRCTASDSCRRTAPYGDSRCKLLQVPSGRVSARHRQAPDQGVLARSEGFEPPTF